ncbi:iron complex transport system ATP-binding protein [Peptoclostridium litorale DSM 5388]|uniref:ABC-type cobalamin/Fe3+-siderophores transport system ATPase component n=1 Tax=Peptoclostridium litorale DSM 5388 TaxID=1121324 RepID=A0A069RHL2_PEPLI|nr:ABC transporter ATP-binding protein [Peptoclostridium litorale]KDR96501.1 ABC-type cobalamin/Fe3+-siderophores transport system ATPase component [Peptoclostridium litorale DSM 5388]SIN69858.1 iron complex transport system ATP-binding protein [Peptoclostridium litorale DSM 5388]
MISVKNLSFSYGKKALFENLNINLQKGQFISLLGPNGCGKSTLLNLISGHLSPKLGSISIDGESVHRLGDIEKAKKFTFVRQHQGNVFPYLCMDYVLLGRRPYKSSFEDFTDEDFTAAQGAMEKARVLDFAGNHLHELSGGELQRVVFAKALAQHTQYIFLDEPFSAMDIFYSIHCLGELRKKVRDENATVVCVMHDINLALQCSDCVVLLDRGKVYSAGPAGDLLTPDSIRDVYGIQVDKINDRGFFIREGGLL